MFTLTIIPKQGEVQHVSEIVERVGTRLLEVAHTALTRWSESTLNSALANALNPRDREKSQLHQYLLLLKHLVVSKCLSSKLVRQIAEVILQLAIDKAKEQPGLTKVFAEAWVLMLAENGSPLHQIVWEAAFVKTDPLSLPCWTWLVEWLHRCGANVEHAPWKLNGNGESMPGAKDADAYYAIYRMRRGLLNMQGQVEGVDYEMDRCMSRERGGHKNNDRDPAVRASVESIRASLESNRQRLMSLDVERAGYQPANGSYLYLGHLLKPPRAVYARVVGTRVFLLMPVVEEPDFDSPSTSLQYCFQVCANFQFLSALCLGRCLYCCVKECVCTRVCLRWRLCLRCLSHVQCQCR